jgi:hypothetical protein
VSGKENGGSVTLYDCKVVDESGYCTLAILTCREITTLVGDRIGRSVPTTYTETEAFAVGMLVLKPMESPGEWSDDDWSIEWKTR